MNIIYKDIMNYKTYLKNDEAIIIKLRIIKHIIIDKWDIKDVSNHYSMHRNTITKIMKIYNSNVSLKIKEKIENNISLSSDDIKKNCNFLLPESTKPKSHPKQASISEEKDIVSNFELLKIGAKKLKMIMKRRKKLGNLTLAKIRGVYKRKGFKVKKVRTKNGETRSLYNYQTIGAFEDGYYDTKELADAKSLPEHIYENLQYNKYLPLYEWNIMFVGCRVRFTAYSRGKTSTFGLQFLVLVLSHLRYHGVKGEIRIHTDGGSEFFSNSERKQGEWNSILEQLDSNIDCYNPNWDIRKNLIERSHRSDDEEFLIPFGHEFNTKENFMTHAQEYNDYRNSSRSHSGHGMDGKTPKEKLLALGIYNAEKLLDFKVLNLDSYFYALQKHLDFFYFQRDLKLTPLQKLKNDRKTSIDLITKYSFLKSYAQNVLTHYLIQIFPQNLF